MSAFVVAAHVVFDEEFAPQLVGAEMLVPKRAANLPPDSATMDQQKHRSKHATLDHDQRHRDIRIACDGEDDRCDDRARDAEEKPLM
jgi:hypothetical protein